ncbi:DUF2642 domain-containing protein [Aneurinibacillus tyrosinisolvens]|uniref:DUF2642 domain-containing protein n=1 Tax=Aneurinibacillus tyrosinisolvens TaxID=1443435 RepID=UPI00063EEFCC|nr:DUF2642 domain-containing protein [Aneurinibacillus tyrosinisolvens]
MYQNPYYSYLYFFPYVYYPPCPSHSPYHSKSKRAKRIEQPGVTHELKEITAVSYPVLSEVEPKNEEALDSIVSEVEPKSGEGEADEKEQPLFKEVDIFSDYFLNCLGKRKGTTVSVATMAGVIKGTLEEVSSHCVLLKVNEESYHIRPEGMIYFK